MRNAIAWLTRALALGIVSTLGLAGAAWADGPSGSTECALANDDCDGAVDEDPVGDANGDGLADDDGDGAADEDPPGDALDDAGENQATCSAGTEVNGVTVYAGANGVEACSDGGAPAEGRVIATTDGGGYVAGDGDATNPAPANGYARVDSGGVHCGDPSNQDATAADQSGNTPEDCNAGT